AQEGRFSHAAAGENSQALAASARDKGIDRFDPGAKTMLDALALKRVGRLHIQTNVSAGVDRPLVIQRVPEAIDDPAFERVAHRNAQGRTQGDDLSAGMDAVELAQGHEQNVMI